MEAMKTIAGWGDMDFNGHMRNTAYLDKSGDARMTFFSMNGFSMKEFMRLRFGPVVVKDEIEYFKEINLLDEISVTLEIAGLSDDCSSFKLRNEFYLPDGKIAARVTSSGGWLDLEKRRFTVPPDALRIVIAALPKSVDYMVLSTRIR